MFFGVDFFFFFFHLYCIVPEFNQLELGEGAAFIPNVSSLQHSSEREA